MAPHMTRTNSPRIRAGYGKTSGRGGVLAWLFGRLARFAELRRQRQALHRLDDNMLRDIGLSRADVEREATKPFWMI